MGAAQTTASWQDPPLQTKLRVPPARAHLVPRPRLAAQLDRALDECRLLLVSAPAGFGKTTLVGTWAHAHGWPVAWLSLDKGDNDAARFWAHVIAALQALHAGLAEPLSAALRSAQPPPLETVLTLLINELCAPPIAERPCVLALDDYHVIENTRIHETLAFFLEHLPAQMRLILLTRADPPLPLARLRARNQLMELREADLRFTPPEAGTFLNDVMGLPLGPAEVDTLETRTEGWIAGLQMAALSIRGQADPAAFIRAFGGSNRYILDYLVEEVLQRESGATLDFLLQTSILDELTAPLCNAVTGRADGEEMLAALERANLFIVALDQGREWYRYHHLFADLLRSRLRHARLESVPELHRRASAWYESRGQPARAVEHALAGEHFETAARLVEQAGNAMLAAGAWGLLLLWVRALPADLLAARPALAVFYAWGLVLTGRLDEVERHLCAAEQAMGQACTPAEREYWRGQAVAVRSRAAYLRGDARQAIEYALAAAPLIPAEDLTTRGLLANTLGVSYILTGQLAGASSVLQEARTVSEAAGNPVAALEAAGTMAQIEEARGHLRRAAETYREILRLAGERGDPNAVAAHLNLGNLLYEWDDLAGAEQHLQASLSCAQRLLTPDAALQASLWLARVRLARGDAAGAGALIRQAEGQAVTFAQSMLGDYAAALLAQLALLSGDTPAAAGWAARHSASPENIVPDNLIVSKLEHLTRARLLIVQGDPAEAKRWLDRLEAAAVSAGLAGCTVEIQALRAIACGAHGDIPGAQAALAQALARAEPEGYVRTFVDLGAPMAELLARSPAARGTYARRLLAVFGRPAPVSRPLVEPLSARELEVLRLVAAGKSNGQIARDLVLAPGTVKRHISNICGKLDARSRTECVARAREIGLID